MSTAGVQGSGMRIRSSKRATHAATSGETKTVLVLRVVGRLVNPTLGCKDIK